MAATEGEARETHSTKLRLITGGRRNSLSSLLSRDLFRVEIPRSRIDPAAAMKRRYLARERCLFISANIFIAQIPSDKNIGPRGFFHRVHRAQTRVRIVAHTGTHAHTQARVRRATHKYLTLLFELLSSHPIFFTSRRPPSDFPNLFLSRTSPAASHAKRDVRTARALERESLDGAAAPPPRPFVESADKIAISRGENELMRYSLVICRYLRKKSTASGLDRRASRARARARIRVRVRLCGTSSPSVMAPKSRGINTRGPIIRSYHSGNIILFVFPFTAVPRRPSLPLLALLHVAQHSRNVANSALFIVSAPGPNCRRKFQTKITRRDFHKYSAVLRFARVRVCVCVRTWRRERKLSVLPK